MNSRHALLLIAACLLNLEPMLAEHIGGDIGIHLPRIQCYAEQFWQGTLFPSWCFEADGGVGSPGLLFYPPFSYIVTSLLYPLRWVGLSLYGVFVLAVALATFVAAFGCFRWLKPIAGPDAAVAGAVVYLFAPYHLEVLVCRAALGELWVMAFAPLMAGALRGMLQHKRRAAWWFMLWTALALLSQTAVAVCVLMALGIYVLVQGDFRQWARFAAACAGSLLLTAFYALPVMHYMPFVAMPSIHQHDRPWFDNFVYPLKDIRGRTFLIVGLAGMLAGLGWLFIRLWRDKANIHEPTVLREWRAWSITGAAAAFLLFSPSAPVWSLVDAFAPVARPWRMQSVLVMAASLLTALYVHSCVRRKRSVSGDFAVLILLLFLFEVRITYVVQPRDLPMFNALVEAEFMSQPEFEIVGVADSEYSNSVTDSIHRHENKHPPQVDVQSGNARIQVRQWSGQGIVLEADAPDKGATLRVWQRYFPLWRVAADDGAAVAMTQEKGDGYILLAVPPGHHVIRLRVESRFASILGIGAKQAREEVHAGLR